MAENQDFEKLRNMSPKDLEDLMAAASSALKESQERHKADTKAKIEKILAEAGYTIAEVFPQVGGKTSKGSKPGPGPAKFRDPATGETWTGRGRKPNWLVEKLQAGHSLDEFAV